MHHATVADSWDVAMDALLEHDPEKAHQIVERIRKEHGITPGTASQGFLDALSQVPFEVSARFFELNNAPGREREARREARCEASRSRSGRRAPGPRASRRRLGVVE